jgi:hypothetical protein
VSWRQTGRDQKKQDRTKNRGRHAAGGGTYPAQRAEPVFRVSFAETSGAVYLFL